MMKSQGEATVSLPGVLPTLLLDKAAEPRALRHEQLLQATAIGVTAATGEAFFRLLARHLANTLDAACAVVGIVEGERADRIRTLAFYYDRQWLPNFAYELSGTPCEYVVADAVCIYPSRVQQRFPSDTWLVEHGVESYAGTPLHDSRGRVLGVISILSRQPLADPDAVRCALEIYAARAASELERQQVEESLRASQAALAESEERFRQMAETIRDAFWLFDIPEGKLLYLSPAYETMWGRPRDWIIADPFRWLEAVHEDDRSRAGVMEVPQVAGKFFDDVYRIRRPDGGIRWLHDRRYAVAFRDGVCHRIVGVAEDVTERALAAENHERQAAHLAHMARLSTVGELMASISHEVNQPLYAIANFSSAIGTLLDSGGELNPEQLRRFNDEIRKSAVRAGEIIRRVRSYVGRGPTQWQSVNLCRIVEDSVALLAAEARRRRVRVELVLAEPSPRIMADEVGIQQVIVNLVRNALEAMDDAALPRPTIVVRTRTHASTIELTVEDSGAGMTDEQLSQLFHPFFTTKPDGMGMGLPISKTIVEAHGGAIWATRNEEGGSSFHFTLPLSSPIGAPRGRALPGFRR